MKKIKGVGPAPMHEPRLEISRRIELCLQRRVRRRRRRHHRSRSVPAMPCRCHPFHSFRVEFKTPEFGKTPESNSLVN